MKYIAKRIVQMVPVLLITTIVIFFGMRLLPGDPALLMVGNRASDEAIAAMRTRLGLNEPLIVQYLLFLKQCITFDFGSSLMMKRPVMELFRQKAAVTFSLTLMTMFFSIIISVPLGCIAGIKSDSKIGRMIDSISLTFVSVPEFLTGLILLMVFALNLKWFPVGGWGSGFWERVHALILPSLTVALGTSALVLRNIKSNVVEVMKMDYVAFAYSKGLTPWRIKTKYIFKNSLLSTVTLLTMRMTYMLAGSIVIENVFALPGLFTRYDPIAQDMTALLQSPSAQHFFGTDNLGRDVFARVVYGARVDLLIGIFAMLVPAVIGTLIGLLAGYYGGKIDALVMRILDLFTAFPLMVMVIAIVAILGSGIKNLFIAIWLIGWREYAKLVRSEVLSVKNSEYVAAAKTLGCSDGRILFRHVLPNVINSAFAYAISDIMLCMLMGASLSFLGLGVPTPIPEWGAIISEGKNFLTTAWWMTVFPGVILAITGISISLVGEQVSKRLIKTD